MDRPGAMSLLVIAMTLVGCSSARLVDVPPHSQLRDGELVEVSPSGELDVITEVSDDAERAVVLADGIVVELDGSILRSEGADFVETATGMLLAADRQGQRYATFAEGVLTIHARQTVVDIPVDCDQPLAGVWDGSNTVVAVLCPEELFVVGAATGQVFSRSLPGTGVDISNWGEGFGVLVRSNDDLELYRTPCHEQDLFGLLYNVDNNDVVKVVADVEGGWVALEGDGTLLNFTGEDFEVISDGIANISEVPGVELEFKCQLGAIGRS